MVVRGEGGCYNRFLGVYQEAKLVQTFIAVIGGSSYTVEEGKLAEEVGREIALKGAVLVCGGLGGAMEAACRGAYSQGGLTVGILPGSNPRDANPFVQIPIPTGLGYARNILVVQAAQAVIALCGNYGTLSEIAFALIKGIPVIGLNTWSLSKGGAEDKSIILAANPGDAVEKAMEAAQKRQLALTQGAGG